MREEPDESLMMRCREGDLRAFDALFLRHHRKLFAYIHRMVGRHALAEDLLQETFLRAFAAAPGYTPSARFTTWIYRIATNVCYTALAGRRRREESLTDSLDAPAGPGEGMSALGEFVPDPRPGPQAAALESELGEVLARALAALPDQQRSVFLHYEMDGLSYLEIAAVQCLPMGTVKTHLHRARRNLQTAMSAYLGR